MKVSYSDVQELTGLLQDDTLKKKELHRNKKYLTMMSITILNRC